MLSKPRGYIQVNHCVLMVMILLGVFDYGGPACEM